MPDSGGISIVYIVLNIKLCIIPIVVIEVRISNRILMKQEVAFLSGMTHQSHGLM